MILAIKITNAVNKNFRPSKKQTNHVYIYVLMTEDKSVSGQMMLLIKTER